MSRPSTRSLPLSTLGLKFIVALTGVPLVGFTLVHMAGHLQMFLGPDVYNSYAANLQGLGAIKWFVRIALLAFLTAHIWATVLLVGRNRQARPKGYQRVQLQTTTRAALLMAPAGFTLFAFIVYHLAHFTVFSVHTTFDGHDFAHAVDAMGRHDVYNHFVRSFQDPVVLGIYMLGCLALVSHLRHGVQSLFKTLGVVPHRYYPKLELLGPAVAGFIFVGFVSVPLAAFFGLLKMTAG